MQDLSTKLGYKFQDSTLLDTALRHRSSIGRSNERLEFLGDAVLNLIIANELFTRYPKYHEGELSRLRSNLVKGETLAKLARRFAIGNYLHLGIGEKRSGGFRRTSILADAMEAIIGAIYLDSGFASCRDVVLTWYQPILEDNEFSKKDPKTELQELLQAKKFALPNYEVTAIEGKAHNQLFHVRCSVAELEIISKGVGSSRQKAEQQAASNFLQQMKHD